MNFILAFLGFLLFIVMGMIKTKRKHSDKLFDPLVYLKDEILTFIASAISVVILLLLLPELGELLSPKYMKLERAVAVLCGFFNYALLNFVFNILLPKKFKQQ